MNFYFWFLITIVIFDLFLDLISEYFNLKSLKPDLPIEFKDIYTPEKYTKSQEYTRETTKFGFITGIFGLCLSLTFWLSGGFNWLDIQLMFVSNDIYRGILFIGILGLGSTILNFPFSIYSTFVIEEKYGFNKTTVKTFILDIIKGGGLSIILGIPLLALVLFTLEKGGAHSWFYVWVAITAISLLLSYVAPTWIMTLFNKFSPLDDGELRTKIFDLAKKVDFPFNNVFIIDGSKRSSKSNAFFTGFGKNKRIALYDTLIENHSNEELLSILAHEIGHYKKKHILQGMIIGILHTGMLLFLLSIFIYNPELHKAFFMDKIHIYTGLIFFSILYSPIETILSILMNLLSRKNEYEADNFAVIKRSNKEDMINALKKLSVDNLSNLTPHPFYVFMNYSHPTALERIKAINEINL
ncbi:MAG: M48 family metallopeptidase [Candidatus Kapabacteria bacterium]|nr:M48 family metallopeptidase [Candidatus Kapabacteria bacterium]